MNPKPLTLDPMACALYKLEKKTKTHLLKEEV